MKQLFHCSHVTECRPSQRMNVSSGYDAALRPSVSEAIRPVNKRQSSLSSAGFCLSAASERTELLMALCISQVARWMVTNAPPAAHIQFLLSQL